jgi:pSer/pThr/pTyr-binding forkhead associated (FHA) protein
VSVDPHVGSLALSAAVACFVLLAQPRRRDRADDTLAMFGAVELRVAEPGGTRTVSAPLPVIIGRAPSATLVLSDVQVSRMHARIDVWDGELGVRDLGSRNGTWLNARPIDEPEPLAAGDQLELGETRIEVRGVGPVRPRRAERNSRTHRKLSP